MIVDSSKRVVITGMGAVSSLGCGIEIIWDRLIGQHSGLRKITDINFTDVASKVAGYIPDVIEDSIGGFDINRIISTKDQRKMDRFIHLAIEAADQAITQSNWIPVTDQEKGSTATVLGSSIGGFKKTEEAIHQYHGNNKRVSPFAIPSFLANLAAGQVSIRHSFKGPMGSPFTACAASTQAIIDGARLIYTGEAKIAVCGGSESCIDPVILQSFCSLGAVSSSFNDMPTKASRPFSAGRDGFVIAEGAAVLVIESLEHALMRGAKPLAEIVGYGTTSDSFHITSSAEEGTGLQQSMKNALHMASISAQEIDYLNAHASSTPKGDLSEAMAIHSVFEKNSKLSISATKSATGHLLGATGSLEAIFTILAIQNGIVPPTLNFQQSDELISKLNIIGPYPERKEMTHGMTVNCGFGGVNAALIFKRYVV